MRKNAMWLIGCGALATSAMTATLTMSIAAQSITAQPRDTVIPIRPPRVPLPTEAASARETRFSFIAYGDTRGRHDGVEVQAEHQLVMESMVRTIASMSRGPDPVRFVVQSGDAAVNGRDAKQWNVSFTPLINRLTTEAGVPYFLVPGNHDVTSSSDINNAARKEGLGNFLQAVSRLIPPNGSPRRMTDYPTYAFGYGNTFVIGFDSNIAGDSTQLMWVRAQLSKIDRKRFVHVVAFMHHPAFSSGPHGGITLEEQTAAVRANYMPLFRKSGVDLIIAGHEHLFEHWIERYRDASGATRRIDQIVTGGGGAPLYTYQGEPDLKAYLKDNVADSVRVEHLVKPGVDAGENPYHYVVVHVDGARLWVDVIGVDWGRNFQPYRSARAVLSDPPSQK